MGVFFTPETARRELFPGLTRWTPDSCRLEGPRREAARQALGSDFSEESARFDRVYAGDSLMGTVFFAREIGKVEYIDFAVALDPRDLVQGVLVMAYRESVGGEVSSRRFLSQFRGKEARHRLRLNREIDAITGATLSSRAITSGVRKALAFRKTCHDST